MPSWRSEPGCLGWPGIALKLAILRRRHGLQELRQGTAGELVILRSLRGSLGATSGETYKEGGQKEGSAEILRVRCVTAVARYCIAVNLLKPFLGELHPGHPGVMEAAHVFTTSGWLPERSAGIAFG